jgi:hypothetical protein
VDVTPAQSGVLLEANVTRKRFFDGFGDQAFIPADPTIAVGANHLAIAVNASVQMMDKDGNLTNGPFTLQSFFTPAGYTDVGDPQLIFDQTEGATSGKRRFYLTYFAQNLSTNSGGFVLAVSKTGNPNGTWCTYFGDTQGSLPDQPHIGVTPQGIYVSANMYPVGSDTFQGADLFTLVKSDALSCTPRVPGWRQSNLQNTNGGPAFTVVPANAIKDPGLEYMVTSYLGFGAFIWVWTVAGVINSTTPPVVSNVQVPSATYDRPPDAEIPGSYVDLNTTNTRIQSATYRANHLVVTQNTYNFTTPETSVAAVRLYDISVTSGTVNSITSMDLQSPSTDIYHGAATISSAGVLGVVFNFSNASRSVSIAEVSNVGGVWQSALIIAFGIGTLPPDERWGDYSGAATDPSQPWNWFYSAAGTGEITFWSDQTYVAAYA